MKKLQLKKEVIARLTSLNQSQIQGGEDTKILCQTINFCPETEKPGCEWGPDTNDPKLTLQIFVCQGESGNCVPDTNQCTTGGELQTVGGCNTKICLITQNLC